MNRGLPNPDPPSVPACVEWVSRILLREDRRGSEAAWGIEWDRERGVQKQRGDWRERGGRQVRTEADCASQPTRAGLWLRALWLFSAIHTLYNVLWLAIERLCSGVLPLIPLFPMEEKKKINDIIMLQNAGPRIEIWNWIALWLMTGFSSLCSWQTHRFSVGSNSY